MNYSNLIRGLTADIKSFVAYKKLSGIARILAVLLLLPFVVSTLLGVVTLWVMLFFFKGLTAAVEYLECWLKETKEGTRHATEAVIYYVCLPVIFVFRVMFSVFAICFYFNWFATMCSAYVATLGGIKWQPFITEAAYDDKEYDSNIVPEAAEKRIISTVLLIVLPIVVLTIIGLIIGLIFDAMAVTLGFFVVGAVIATVAYLCFVIGNILKYRKVELAAEAPAEEAPVEA